MFKTFTALLAALLLPMPAPAQDSLQPNPLDPRAATTPLVYRSALGGYKKRVAEPPPVAWREANDSVERAGGWRALAREAAGSLPAPAAASAPGRGGMR